MRDSSERLPWRRALVVGWARSGRAAAEVLRERGVEVWATDARPDPEDVPAWLGRTWWGGHPETVPAGVDLVVASPGVSPALPLAADARRRRITLLGEVELAARLGRAPMLGVTGTNGKSTVVTMLGECFTAAGREALVGGNVGTPLVSVYPQLPEAAAAIVELSSYQIEWAERLRVHGAVVLNLQPDHAGRHPTMESYWEAKARLLDFQESDDFAVLFEDDPQVAAMAPRVRGTPYRTSLARAQSRGAWLAEDGWLMAADGGEPRRVMARAELPLPGDHNVANALCAAAACMAWGLALEPVASALRRYRLLPHRLERVGRVGGVLLVNDSKATNVDAAIVAVRAIEGPFVLIAGGEDKGFPFAPLREVLAGRARAIVLTGAARERMERELGGAAPIHLAEDLAAALHRAVEILGGWGPSGGEGAVLFSPACSSFDRFRDFEHRGEVFREASRSLPGFREEA